MQKRISAFFMLTKEQMFGIIIPKRGDIMDRTILHCDLNNFYASVECAKNPKLFGRPVAVCGNEDDRHGIVLAKSQPAKECGIKTGDTVIEAKRKCKDVIIVHPDFESYYNYSEQVKDIYKRYTDLIEPFGMDECWLDVSGSEMLFGNGEHIADELRKTVQKETGLTISVGVSFNKVFAKLGSDMKKPDATTVISRKDFKEKIWRLPADTLLFVGRKTFKTLQKYGVETIGDIANASPSFMRKILGKNGFDLWLYANGADTSPVSHMNIQPTLKSVSRGITCVESLVSVEEAERVISELCAKVSKSLRQEHLLATGVQVAVKNESLTVQQYSSNLDFPTHNSKELFIDACCVLSKNHRWKNNVRSITVRAYNLISDTSFQQLTVDYDIEEHDKIGAIDDILTQIRNKYGNDTVFCGCRLFGTKMPTGKSEHSSLPPASF